MERVKEADIQGSIDLFDAADSSTGGMLRPYLWQRGISYYYADRFEEGSNQVGYLRSCVCSLPFFNHFHHLGFN